MLMGIFFQLEKSFCNLYNWLCLGCNLENKYEKKLKKRKKKKTCVSDHISAHNREFYLVLFQLSVQMSLYVGE